jgi:fucose 4-O-acetylase-like acetyltransferase
MPKTQQTTLIWLNRLKTLGILAVILGHITSPFNTFIFSWHMPLFFFYCRLFY